MSEETTTEITGELAAVVEEPSVMLSGGTAYIPLTALTDGWVATVTMTCTLTLTRPAPPVAPEPEAPKRTYMGGAKA